MTRYCWAEMYILAWYIHCKRTNNGHSQRNWPKNFYSALAGFVEPGESHEDTVEREMWEEAGVKVLGVKYHSTQPWVCHIVKH